MIRRASLRLVVTVAIFMVGLAGAAMCADWLVSHGRNLWPALLQDFAALGTGAALLLSAATLAMLMLGLRRWSATAALLMVALGFTSLVAAALSEPLMAAIPVPSPVSLLGRAGPMTPLFALALVTAGAGLFAGSVPHRFGPRITALNTLGGVVAAVAGFSGLGLLAGWGLGEESSRLRGMSAGAALGLLAVGVAMLALARQALAAHRTRSAGPAVHDAAPFSGLAFGALLTLTFLAFAWMLNDIQVQLQARFKRATINVVDDIGDRMPAYALALRGSAHYVQQMGQILPADWVDYVKSLKIASTFPGVLGYGYVEAVPQRGLTAHQRRWGGAWTDGYQVYPPGQRDEYFPVVLLGPGSDRSRKVIGYDHYSELTRREAIDLARDRGEPVISRSVVLVLDRDKPHEFGFQMYMPVYRKGLPASTVEERQRALTGLVFSPFRISDLMRGILQDRYGDIRTRVMDGEFATGAQLVYDSAGAADGKIYDAAPPGAVAIGAIIFGRRWTVVTSPLPAFYTAEPRSGPWIVLAAGTVIGLLLAAAIWQVFAIQARMRSLAAAQALHAETESRLRAEQALRVEREEARLKVEALNRQLSRRAADLEIANRDLEAFSYSVSHDLQQPVTGIAAYASMALEDFTDQMSEEVKGFFERIQVAGFRMSQLISGLLALSSIARSELTHTRVDLTALAREAIAELEATHKLREIEIVIADGLVATGDKRLLQILVTNLLGNAWKYTGKTEHPRIEMGVAETPHGRAFFVRDNGAGFDMAKAEKLFQAFHRLHKEKDFPGTGIGLATVSRVVLRHGGNIWAEAKPGEGATFYFTLPEDTEAASAA